MKQNAQVRLEIEKNDRIYAFTMPIGAPYGEAYDSGFEFLQQITKMSHEAAERAKRENITLKTDEIEKESAEEVVEE